MSNDPGIEYDCMVDEIKEMQERIKQLEDYIKILEQKVASITALLEAKDRVEKASPV